MAYHVSIIALCLLTLTSIAIHGRLPTPVISSSNSTRTVPVSNNIRPVIATPVSPVISSSSSNYGTIVPVDSNHTPPEPVIYNLTPAIIMPSGPSLPPYFYQDELNNMHRALRRNFSIWVIVLAQYFTTPDLPAEATLFVPRNDAVLYLRHTLRHTTDFDRNLLLYHVIPQRLTFAQLGAFQTNSTLPTLLPSKTLQVTANTTIENTFITHPDFYLSSVFAVHEIEHLF